MVSAQVRLDPELGVVRLCGRCEEEWPDDDEFWLGGVEMCRACYAEFIAEVRRHRREQMRAASRRYYDRTRRAAAS